MTNMRTVTMAAAINEGLDTAMSRDDHVILLGEDIADPAGGVVKITKGLSAKYGRERVLATPIAEQAIVGAAIGASMAGYKPVAEIMFMDFLPVCLDQVVNHAAKLRYMSGGLTTVPITIRALIGNGDNAAQHSQSLEAIFMSVPGLKIVVPSTPADARGLLLSCIADEDPCLFFEPLSLLFKRGEVDDDPVPVPLGQAKVVREGTDITLLAWGGAMTPTLEAAQLLAGEGVNAEVIDVRTLVPLDRKTILSSVKKTRRAAVVHAATRFAGPGAEIAAMITEELFDELRGPVLRFAAPDAPIPYSRSLLTDFFPAGRAIADSAAKAVGAGAN
jgi:pyruvate/2-oxoglutarate/acetoin dehydrogenase E1 component